MVLGKHKRNRITRNYNAIKDQVAKNVQRSPLMSTSGNNMVRAMAITEDVMGFVAIAADEYDKKKDNIGFENSVAHRAVLRYQDAARKEKRHFLNSVTNMDINNIKKEVPSGYYFDETESKIQCEDIKECFDEHFQVDIPENKIYRDIFYGYIYPNMTGQERKSLKQIGEDNNICASIVLVRMKDKEMQSFVHKYMDVDIDI